MKKLLLMLLLLASTTSTFAQKTKSKAKGAAATTTTQDGRWSADKANCLVQNPHLDVRGQFYAQHGHQPAENMAGRNV
jgi:hypothetical protein